MSMYEPCPCHIIIKDYPVSQNENRNSVMHAHGMVIVQLFDRRHETSCYYINFSSFQVQLNEYDQALPTDWTEDEVLIIHNVINEHVFCW